MANNNETPSLNQNDWSVSDDVRRASITSKTSQYVDLDLNLVPNPFTDDIQFLRDDRAVTGAVRNLLLTNFFERPFSPLLGANLIGLLFEPADAITIGNLEEAIARVITKHEPRVALTGITIDDDVEGNAYNVTVKFRIKEINQTAGVSIRLTRLR